MGDYVYLQWLSPTEAAFGNGEVDEQKLIPPGFHVLAVAYKQVLDSLVKM